MKKELHSFDSFRAGVFFHGGIWTCLLSTYITKSLKTISDRINETSLSQKNKKIVLEASSKKLTY
jgi:hypothetical protein